MAGAIGKMVEVVDTEVIITGAAGRCQCLGRLLLAAAVGEAEAKAEADGTIMAVEVYIHTYIFLTITLPYCVQYGLGSEPIVHRII